MVDMRIISVDIGNIQFIMLVFGFTPLDQRAALRR
jgi:hypothetical protein